MSTVQRSRVQRYLREAEGYLELRMPQQALEALDRIGQPSRLPKTVRVHVLYLRGEALRLRERYREALVFLEQAADAAPDNIHVWVSLGWCYKRAGQLMLAIEALENALDVAPDHALLHYNLACYWSLAGEKRRALRYLEEALELDSRYRDMVADEPDFDAIRNEPEFLSLTSVIV